MTPEERLLERWAVLGPQVRRFLAKRRRAVRHARGLARESRQPDWSVAPDRQFRGTRRAAVRTLREWGRSKREAKLLATRRFSTFNRRRRRHGMRRR